MQRKANELVVLKNALTNSSKYTAFEKELGEANAEANSTFREMSQHQIGNIIPEIHIDDYIYDLPEEQIATAPLPERDQSKLLMVQAKTGEISHHHFSDLPDLLPAETLLVFNNSKVIAARLALKKQSGGKVEVLCVEPSEPNSDITLALLAKGAVKWKCLLHGRNLKALMTLSTSVMHQEKPLLLKATLVEKGIESTLCFEWQPKELSFLEVLEAIGKAPLPPYLKREPTQSDKLRYQTVYAKSEGSVAAPTAGLHFTPAVLERLRQKGVSSAELTLHVGLGTFKPVQQSNVQHHVMHAEQISVPKQTLLTLHNCIEKGKSVVAVGTTSMRVLESLYWFGVKLLLKDNKVLHKSIMNVEQWEAYTLASQLSKLPATVQSLEAVLEWLQKHSLDGLSGKTQLMIVPGYRYMMCDGLITNFHQPRSTLILLVAAFLGQDLWKKIYNEALQNGYRFLSYGDSSLLWR